jgi:hypothetical protein
LPPAFTLVACSAYSTLKMEASLKRRLTFSGLDGTIPKDKLKMYNVMCTKSNMFSVFKFMLIRFFYLSNYFSLQKCRMTSNENETVFLIAYIEISEKVLMVHTKILVGIKC